MIFNYIWLKKLLGIKSPQNVAEVLSSRASVSDNFSGIIAAKVTKISKHPNADRLQVVELTDGEKTIAPIVCGAFNFKVNDIVALALPGARIPQNIHSDKHEAFVLEKAKIRGIESQGMIVAAFELGLAETPGQGIMVLKNDAKLGSGFSADLIR